MISKDRLLHLCFDEEDFKQDCFNAAQFLIKKRRHVTIEMLRKDLRTYSEHLKVVQLINTDLYDNFLAVANKLSGVDVELLRISEPLPEMMGKVDKATKKLEDSRDVVEQKLQECKAIDANRCYYLQLLKTTVMEDKITDWFDSCPDAGDAQSDLDNFRRIAIECKQLQEDEARSISTCCEQEEEKQAMLQRTQALRDKYEGLLQDRFVYVLRRQQELVLEEEPGAQETDALKGQAAAYLDCYRILEKEELAAELFREHVCKEVVDKVLSWTVTGNQRNAPPEALQQLFAELLGTIEKRCIPLVEIAMRISVDFRFIKSIWKCFMDVAIKRMQNIFSPGIPSKFHTHYTAAHNLLLGLEAHVATAEELQDFRSCEEMELWNSKWLLSVYTALRQKEAMAELTNALQQHLHWHGESQISTTGYNYAQVWAVHKLVFWFWGDSVCIYPIADQLMKMTLRTMSVLDRWFVQFLAATSGVASPAASDEQSAFTAAPGSAPAPAPATGTAQDMEVEPAAEEMAEESKTVGLVASALKLNDLMALYVDLLTLQKALTGELYDAVMRQMHQSQDAALQSSEVVAAIRCLCDHCSKVVDTQLATVQQRITGYVAKECIDTLVSPLKSITSLYRMTKKPVPMRFSFFIPTILTAAQNFQQCCTPDAEKTVPLHCRLSKPVLDDCVRAVLKQVTKVYHDEAKALLITAKKAETAVSALRKKQKKAEEDKAADAKEDMSDTDKIFVQIYLDIQEYGNQLKTQFGLDDTFEPYVTLLGLVRRAAWLLGEIPDEPPNALET